MFADLAFAIIVWFSVYTERDYFLLVTLWIWMVLSATLNAS